MFRFFQQAHEAHSRITLYKDQIAGLSSHSTYSGKVFRVTLLSLGAFLLLPLLAVILLLESPIQPELLR